MTIKEGINELRARIDKDLIDLARAEEREGTPLGLLRTMGAMIAFAGALDEILVAHVEGAPEATAMLAAMNKRSS